MATNDVAYGGIAVTDVFLAKTDHTAIQKKDDSAAATALADRVIRLGDTSGENLSETTDITPAESSATIAIAHTNMSEDFTTFTNLFLPKTATAAAAVITKEEKTSESGRKIGGGGGTASSTKQSLIINYGPVTAGKVLVTLMLAGWNVGTGQRQTKNGWITPKAEATSVPNKKSGGLSVPAALFDPAIVTVSTAQVIPQDSFMHEIWLPKA